MGLDTSYDCWHGAYSAFSRWRNKLAEIAGYWVTRVEDEGMLRDTIVVDWGHLQGHLLGEWDKTPDDPLLVLIVHADCEGVIHPVQASPLADRLEALLPLLPEGDGGGHIGLWREKTQTFINGLREAARNNDDVLFG